MQHVEAKDTLDVRWVVSLADGGTSAVTAPRAAQNLRMLLSYKATLPEGPIRIDHTTGKIPAIYFEGVADYRPEVDGKVKIGPGVEQQYEITNYDSRIEYSVTATEGTVRRDFDRIYYTAPTDISKTPGFTLNGEFWPLSFA